MPARPPPHRNGPAASRSPPRRIGNGPAAPTFNRMQQNRPDRGSPARAALPTLPDVKRKNRLQRGLDRLLSLPGRALVWFLTRETREYQTFAVYDRATLAACLQPCDILLVEGNQWISGAIKYLTQSTWSHAALYVGNIIEPGERPDDPKVLIEADIKQGVIGVPLSTYTRLNTRICRPVGLTPEDKARVINYMMRHLGMAYDLKNVVDLARYLLPTPPVPGRFRRRLLALGSGDPTRAICSSLIAQAFQSVRYPILPDIVEHASDEELVTLYTIRHHSLFTPRDFDLSPYFAIVKPTLENGFDYRQLRWQEDEADAGEAVHSSADER